MRFDLPDGQGGTLPAENLHVAHVATLAYEFARIVTTDALLSELSARAPA